MFPGFINKLSPIIEDNAMILNFLENNLLDNYYSQKVIFLTVFKECNEDCKQINGNIYRKVASSNTSRLEAHDGFFRLFVKGIFDPYVL